MTISEYYYTFGFIVPIKACLKVLGFTEDNFPTEKRNAIIEEYGLPHEYANIDYLLPLW
jgi:hypothetical protein